MSEGTLRRTPLYDEHKNLGARLVDFAGWEMPVQYSGIKAEHAAVREGAGLFDVSHMGEIIFWGPDANAAVQRLVTRDVSRLQAGQAGYAAVCYESGGTVDDVLVYKRPDDFLVVVNASNREKDLEHFRENTEDLDVEVVDESDDWALLALQGPEALGLAQNVTRTDLSQIKYYRFVEGEVDGVYAIISRTGYTGEDGFELYVRPDDALRIWRKLIEAGAAPVGLGARDSRWESDLEHLAQQFEVDAVLGDTEVQARRAGVQRPDLAVIGHIEPSHQAEQRGFAATARSHDDNTLAWCDLQRHTIERLVCAERFADVRDGEQRRAHRPSLRDRAAPSEARGTKMTAA